MLCPNCGKEVTEGKKFCGYCGQKIIPPAPVTPVFDDEAPTRLESVERPMPAGKTPEPAAPAPPVPDSSPCPVCGWLNRSGAHFCDGCGANLLEEKPQQALPAGQTAAVAETNQPQRGLPAWAWGMIGFLALAVVAVVMGSLNRGGTATPAPTQPALPVSQPSATPAPVVPPTQKPDPTQAPPTRAPTKTVRPTTIPSPTQVKPAGRISFTSYVDGNYEIFVIDADGSHETRLTNNTTDDIDPTWSPDGKQLIYCRLGSGDTCVEIYIMSADGSNQRRLAASPGQSFPPVWSPDGRRIAFSTTLAEGNEDIFIMDLENGNQKRLTYNAGQDTDPVWSPDAQKIVYVSRRYGDTEIYVINADGSNDMALTDNTALERDPCWSPDGKRIAFSSERDGNYEIYVMDADGGNQNRLTNNSEVDVYPAWSPDGQKIADKVMGGVYVMNTDGSGQIKIYDMGKASMNPVPPTWSPDGTQIAFRDDRQDHDGILVMDADGENEFALTKRFISGWLSWKP